MLVEAADEKEELRVAARWVRKFLEEQPAAKVAVIVPGLETQRREIDRVFREVLAPELEDIRAASESGAVRIFAGGCAGGYADGRDGSGPAAMGGERVAVGAGERGCCCRLTSR